VEHVVERAALLVGTAIEAIAIAVIAIGVLQALVRLPPVLLRSRSDASSAAPTPWLDFGRWLIAGLTFQLAADIIETSITTSWEAVARLAAIAVIRTFLNYFLDRDLEEIRTREREGKAA
jgi:uncharacterized membrane protein